MLRPYEALIIFDPNLDDDALRVLVDRSTDLLASSGAAVGRVERWGKRRLAYEIRHQREGYYVLVEATGTPDTLAELNRSLLLTDEVLRHKIIRVPDVVAGARRPGAGNGQPDVAADQAAPAS